MLNNFKICKRSLFNELLFIIKTKTGYGLERRKSMKILEPKSSKIITEFFDKFNELSKLSENERKDLLRKLSCNEAHHSNKDKYEEQEHLEVLKLYTSDLIMNNKIRDVDSELIDFLYYLTKPSLGIQLDLNKKIATIIVTRCRTVAIPGFVIFNFEDESDVALIINLLSNNQQTNKIEEDFVIVFNKIQLIKNTSDIKIKIKELKELLTLVETQLQNSLSPTFLYIKTMFDISTSRKLRKSLYDLTEFSDELTISVDALAFYSSEINQLKIESVPFLKRSWLKKEKRRLEKHGYLSIANTINNDVIKEGLGCFITFV